MYHILYIDDEKPLLEIAKLFLEDLSEFLVDTEISAANAIKLIETTPYDAIISDYQMPEMSGIDVLKKIRASGNTVPFIIFTGRGREEVVIEAIDNGADFYLQKGGDPGSQFAELKHKVRIAIERKSIQRELEEKKEQLSEIIGFFPDAVLAIDADKRVIIWNHAIEQMTGIQASEMIGKGDYLYTIPFYGEARPQLMDLLFDPDHPIARQYSTVKREGDIITAEAFCPALNNGKGAIVLARASPLRDSAGTTIGVIESIRDITDRKQAEEKNRESEEFIREVISSASEGIVVYDRELRIVLWNRFMEDLTGLQPTSVVGKKALELFPFLKAAGVDKAMAKALSGEPTASDDFPFRIGETGKSGWVKGIYSPHYDSRQNIIGVIGIIRDITHRKVVEQSLRESEERYRNVVEDQTEFISRFLPDGTHIFVNEAYCRYFGFGRDEILYRRFKPEIPEEDRERLEHLLCSLTPDHPVDNIEHRIVMPDGQIRWQQWSDRAIFDKDGHIVEYQSVGRDITDKKHNEVMLRESETRLQLALSGSDLGMWELDIPAMTGTIDERAANILGHRKNEIGVHRIEWDALSHPEDVPLIEKRLTDYVEGRAPVFESEHRMWHASGDWIWVSGKGKITRRFPDGSFRITGTLQDITPRKRAEEALREIEQRLTDIINFLPDATFAIDRSGQVIAWNRAIEEMTGTRTPDMTGKGNYEYAIPLYGSRRRILIDLVNEPDEMAREYYTNVIREKGTLTAETILSPPGGMPRVLLCKASPLCNQHGEPIGAIESIRDITELTTAIKELRSSEEKYRLVVEHSHDLIYIYRDHRFLFFNNRVSELCGYGHDELITMNIWNLIHPDDRERLQVSGRRRISGEQVPSTFSARFLTKNGDIREGEFFVERIMYQGQPAILGIIRDMTERKRIEEALRESETRYKNVVEDQTEYICRFLPDGTHVFVNEAYCRIFHKHREDLIGHVFFPNIPNEDRKIVREHFGSLTPKNPVALVTHRVILPDDAARWHRWSDRAIFDTTGTIVEYQSVGRDITDQKEVEEKIRHVNRQLNLLSSITRHDALNQLLVLKGYLRLLRDGAGDPPGQAGFLEKAEIAAHTIEAQILFMREYQDMGLKMPRWHQVDASVRKAAERLPMRDIRISTDCADLEIYADPLFEKVFYNLINNALLHGGEAMTNIRITSHESGDGLRITCEDDGAGITENDKKWLFTKGFGKHTGLGLFLCREILSITGITITENGLPGKGARFVIIVPKGMYRYSSKE